jgi:hypothetical protein
MRSSAHCATRWFQRHWCLVALNAAFCWADFAQAEGQPLDLSDVADRASSRLTQQAYDAMTKKKITCEPTFDALHAPIMAVFRAVDQVYVLCMSCDNFNRTKLQRWPVEAAEKVVLWSGPKSDEKYCPKESGKCKMGGFSINADHTAKASFAHYGMVADAASKKFKQILILEDDFCWNTNTEWEGHEVEAFEHFLAHQFNGYLRLSFYGYLTEWFKESNGNVPHACACKLDNSHVCQIKKGCDLRGSEAYVLHHSLFPMFVPGHTHGGNEMWIDMWPRIELETQLVLPPLGVQGDFHKSYYLGGYKKYAECALGLQQGGGLCTPGPPPPF